MTALNELRTAEPAKLSDELARVCVALVRMARLALESETSGQSASGAAAVTLELAEELMGGVLDAVQEAI